MLDILFISLPVLPPILKIKYTRCTSPNVQYFIYFVPAAASNFVEIENARWPVQMLDILFISLPVPPPIL
jgi:hypothetical protein